MTSGWSTTLTRITLAAAVLAAVCAAVPPLLAQSVSSSLGGRVLDEKGKPVEAAIVRAESLEDGSTRRDVTDAEGRFLIASIAPGKWQIDAETPDGTPIVPRIVPLALQQRLEIDLVVTPEFVEEMTVSGEVPLLDSNRSWSELRIDGTQSDALPIDGRNVTDLATLDSSILQAAPGQFYGERGNVFVVNGQSGRANAFLVDGLDNGDRTSSTTLNSFFSQGVIDEFVVMTRQFDAEFGRASGGVLNILTRRGSNKTTGELFLQGTVPDWNSSGAFVDSLPDSPGDDATRRTAFGFGAGGPIRRDKAFYYVSYEGQRAEDALPYTGTTREEIDGGVLLAPVESDSFFFRTDFNLGDRNFLMARVSFDDRSDEGLNVTGRFTPEAGFTLDEKDAQLALSWKSVISPRVISEARLLIGSSEFEQDARSGRPGVERPSGIFGGNDLNRQFRTEDRIQLVENVTWSTGSHTMKFGFDILDTQTDVDTLFNPNGAFLYQTDDAFDPGDCGDLNASDIIAAQMESEETGELVPVPCVGIPDFDDDGDGVVDEPGQWWTYPIVFRLIDGQPNVELNDTSVALFVQDSWQVSSDLMLSFGLRYDVSSFELPPSARVDSTIPNGGAEADTDNWAPRIAFTYRPGGSDRVLLRGGAGVFYDKLPLAFPAVSDVTAGTEIGLLFVQGFALEITEDTIEELGIDLIKQALRFPEEFILRFSTATELETPYVVQYSVGAEVETTPFSVLSLDVERALGYHNYLMRDLNPVVEISPIGFPIHRDPDIGSIASIVSEGRTWYTGVTTAWRYRRVENWLNLSYTWSQALDYASDPLKGGVSLPPNSDDIEGEKARSDSDRRHRLVVSGGFPVYAGIRAAIVAQYASEAPFNVRTGVDENLDGFANERPEGVTRNTGEETPLGPVNEIRDLNDLPRITKLREPDFLQVDLRLSKSFAVSGTDMRGEIFAQVFNVFDRFNAALVEERVVSPNFGQPLGIAGPPRTLELGLKVAFD